LARAARISSGLDAGKAGALGYARAGTESPRPVGLAQNFGRKSCGWHEFEQRAASSERLGKILFSSLNFALTFGRMV
jgi:hypothetical protein